jgi:hypothetical protein
VGRIFRRGPLSGVEQQRLVMLVEDDEATRAFLADNLAADGFELPPLRARARVVSFSQCGIPPVERASNPVGRGR